MSWTVQSAGRLVLDPQDVRRFVRPTLTIVLALDADEALPLRQEAERQLAAYTKAVAEKAMSGPEYARAAEAQRKLVAAQEAAADARHQLRDVEAKLSCCTPEELGGLVGRKTALQNVLSEYDRLLPALIVSFNDRRATAEQTARNLADQAGVQLLLQADAAGRQLDSLVSGPGKEALNRLLIAELQRGTSGSVTSSVVRTITDQLQAPSTADAGQLVQNAFDVTPGVQTGLQPQPDQWASFTAYTQSKQQQAQLVPGGA